MLTAFGASFGHSSMSISPTDVDRTTFPAVGGSRTYIADIVEALGTETHTSLLDQHAGESFQNVRAGGCLPD